MTDKPNLADARRVAEAATEGPWDVVCLEPADGDYPPERYAVVTERVGDHIATLDASERWSPTDPMAAIPEDATFIAASRTLVPALLAAVDAVLALHVPRVVKVIDNPECVAEECDHDGACPATGSVTVCAGCDEMCESAYTYYSESHLHVTDYPCPTVRAITAHLDIEPR